MKIPPVLLFCLLPYASITAYDESSTRKINLEDIEDDHIKNERQSKSMPPPLSQQPAKGHPVQLYPPTLNEDYPIPNSFDTHRFSTRAHQHVQPLTDQPTAPAEAEYQHQQSPAYHGEEVMYLPAGQQLSPHNQQPLYDVRQQEPQPAPHFYYSHDIPQQQPAGNGNVNENEYQIQFVPIEQQHGGSDEQQQQHSFHGPSQVTVPSTAAPSEQVSYSHDVGYDEAPQAEMQQHQQQPQQELQQQQELIHYPIGNGIREPNYAQNVYGLPPDVLFQSQKDIEYAKPTDIYGLPPMQYFKKEEFSQRDYSQEVTSPKPTPTPATSYQSYSDQMKSTEYKSQPSQTDLSPSNSYQNVKTSQEPALSYGYDNKLVQASTSTSKAQSYYLSHQNGFMYNQKAEENENPALSENYEKYPHPLAPSETQTYYLNHLKEIKSVHHAESSQSPSISYGPPDMVGKEPQIEYGVPDAPFRRPVAESNQDVYAPRRPSSSGRSGKSFAVSFPYPPSFVSFTTTEKLPSEKTASALELSSSNEVNPWRPIHVRPSAANKYRSLGQTHESNDNNNQPLPDFFHTRRAKSLLDSYIPSWLVRRMQEEHARQGQQDHQGPHQSYSIPSPQAEDSYNTISYSSHENIFGNHFKRSLSKKKTHEHKKAQTSDEGMTAME